MSASLEVRDLRVTVGDVPAVHGLKSLARRILWAGLRAFFRLVHMAETGEPGSGLILTQNLLAVARKAALRA